MPSCAAPPLYVEAPIIEPVKYGLFTASNMLDFVDPHEGNGVMWEPYTCERATPQGCSCSPSGMTKTLRGADPVVETEPFFVYGSYKCKSGFSQTDANARALQHLLLGEERAVEHAIMTGLSSPSFRNTAQNPVTNLTPGATGLADGDALSFVAAWATLEEALGERYAGRGVIHAPKAAAIYASANHLLCGTCDTDRLTSVLGSGVVAGGGYSANTGPDGTEAPAGEVWLYATGIPQIGRGEVLQRTEIGETLDRSTNDVISIAERMYTLGWDCGTVAVKTRLTCP